ncbi:uncharacterized protein LOC144822773 [Lissotriton helveticus]
MTEGAEFVTSQKGKLLLCYMGYTYTQEKQYGMQVNWKCCKYYSNKCYGRATTKEATVLYTREHNHPPNVTEIEVRTALENIKEASTGSQKQTNVILKEAIPKIPKTATTQMPNILSLKRTIARTKKATTSTTPSPRTYQDINLTANQIITLNKQPFIVYDNENNDKRLIIFGTSMNLVKLQQSQYWMMDGTFNICPKPFFQLYTIHGLYHNCNIPLLYALLPNKNNSTYMELINIIKQKTNDFSPESIILDFEQAMLSTIIKIHPHTCIQGCYYHLNQCLWRHLQKTTLSVEYATNSSFAFQIKKLIALAYVPETDVAEHYNILIDSPFYKQNEAKLSPFLDYFEDTWVGRLHRSGHRRNPKFLIPWWNVYRSTLNGDSKTNNAVEGWHNAFVQSTGRTKPTLEHFIKCLQKEQSYQEFRMDQSVTELVPKTSKQNKQMHKYLEEEVKLYPSTKGIEYLNIIAKTLL